MSHPSAKTQGPCIELVLSKKEWGCSLNWHFVLYLTWHFVPSNYSMPLSLQWALAGSSVISLTCCILCCPFSSHFLWALCITYVLFHWPLVRTLSSYLGLSVFTFRCLCFTPQTNILPLFLVLSVCNQPPPILIVYTLQAI